MDFNPMVVMEITSKATMVIVGMKTISSRRDNRLEKD